MSTPLLDVRDLHVTFTTPRGESHAVRGVNLRVARGQVYGVVGESGCGKTLTGRAVLGILPKNAHVRGDILFDGTNLVSAGRAVWQGVRGDRVTMIFQNPGEALNPVFTIGEQMLSVMRRHHHEPKGVLRGNAERLLEDVGLPDPKGTLGRYPHQLSGGMQQRVMIALALSADPDLIIADEPTTALDVTTQAQILDLLQRLTRERGLSVLLITHDMGVVAEICDEVAVFYAGRVAEVGPTKDLLFQPRHPYTQGLLAALPHNKIPRQDLEVIAGSVPSGYQPIDGCAFADRCPRVMPVCQHAPPPTIALTDQHHAVCHLDQESDQGRA